MRPIAAVLGLIIAVPMVFVVALTQVNGLQDQAKGLVPDAIDPIMGVTTFLVLLLVIPILIGAIMGVFHLIDR
jgi:uncharacterized membrane protein (DUF106 family)